MRYIIVAWLEGNLPGCRPVVFCDKRSFHQEIKEVMEEEQYQPANVEFISFTRYHPDAFFGVGRAFYVALKTIIHHRNADSLTDYVLSKLVDIKNAEETPDDIKEYIASLELT